MNESHITVHGYVAAIPVVRTVGEHKVANFRLGVTPRRLEKASGQWYDAETQWYTVSAWRALGENVASSLRKGDPVIVQGRLTARTWINAKHAEVLAHDIEATFVGHDLRRGVSHFYKTVPSTSGEADGNEATAPTMDPAMGPVPDDELPSDLMALAHGDGSRPGGGSDGETGEAADRSDWNAPLQDAPAWSGAA